MSMKQRITDTSTNERYIHRGSCKTFFDGRVERVDRVDLDAEMFQLAHGVA